MPDALAVSVSMSVGAGITMACVAITWPMGARLTLSVAKSTRQLCSLLKLMQPSLSAA